MTINIELNSSVRGYQIVRKKCPNCGADFVFRLAGKEVHDVIGDALNYPEEKVVRCKICLSTFKYKTYEATPHVGVA